MAESGGDGANGGTVRSGDAAGAVISPTLANLFLHYVLDLWWTFRRKKATCDVIIVRYARRRAVLGFSISEEAKLFPGGIAGRFGENSGLELNPEKTA